MSGHSETCAVAEGVALEAMATAMRRAPILVTIESYGVRQIVGGEGPRGAPHTVRACDKPDSVVDGHLSGVGVAAGLVRSTRDVAGGPPCPCSTLLRVGFAEPSRSPGMLVVSYTTVSPLPVLRRPEAIGGLLSVALSIGSPRLGVTQHPALRSPDFPRRVFDPPRPPRRLVPTNGNKGEQLPEWGTRPAISRDVDPLGPRASASGPDRRGTGGPAPLRRGRRRARRRSSPRPVVPDVGASYRGRRA
jgi:hypothetical protein